MFLYKRMLFSDCISVVNLQFQVLACESEMVPEDMTSPSVAGKESPESKLLPGSIRMHEDAGTIGLIDFLFLNLSD